jgi:electron transport complex protein RnfG
MNALAHPVIRSGFLLALIALFGTGLLAAVNEFTRERIIEQEKQRTLNQLQQIIPTGKFNNDLLTDTIEVNDTEFFHHRDAVTIYRARMDDRPVAALMTVTAPDGYNGDIRLLAGIGIDGTVLGVRIISHRETPGLGDPIELERSDWILGFTGKSLRNPDSRYWTVKKDGGQFDQFTGATISPRAVVRAVHNALLYFETNKRSLFDQPAEHGNTE